MTEPNIGDLGLFSFWGDAAPHGWMQCNGQLLPVRTNQALFSLLGNTYGGNSEQFALPDLRGRVPVHPAANQHPGNNGGSASHTVTAAEMPAHTHQAAAVSSSAADAASPAVGSVGHLWGKPSDPSSPKPYGAPADVSMSQASVSAAGGAQAHDNMQPFLTLNWCIAVYGDYPNRP